LLSLHCTSSHILQSGFPTLCFIITWEGFGRVTKTLCTQNEANAFSLWNNNLGYQGILEYYFTQHKELSQNLHAQHRPHVRQLRINFSLYCCWIWMRMQQIVLKEQKKAIP
jgi:hypothetical protein